MSTPNQPITQVQVTPGQTLTHTYPDGRTINIPIPENIIHGDAWANGAAIIIGYHHAPISGLDPSDRIELIIIDSRANHSTHHLNAEDAAALITGLTLAIKTAIDHDHPLKPQPLAIG